MRLLLRSFSYLRGSSQRGHKLHWLMLQPGRISRARRYSRFERFLLGRPPFSKCEPVDRRLAQPPLQLTAPRTPRRDCGVWVFNLRPSAKSVDG